MRRPSQHNYLKEGGAPLHIYALLLHICTFYALFMHFADYSITYTIHDKMAYFTPKMRHFDTFKNRLRPSKCFTQKAVKHRTQDQRPNPQIVSRVKHSINGHIVSHSRRQAFKPYVLFRQNLFSINISVNVYIFKTAFFS